MQNSDMYKLIVEVLYYKLTDNILSLVDLREPCLGYYVPK